MRLPIYYRARRRGPRPVGYGLSEVYVVYTLSKNRSAPLDAGPYGGFQWGFGGHGAGVLAVVMLRDFVRRMTPGQQEAADAVAAHHADEFRRQVVARLPACWELDPRLIAEFLLRACGWRWRVTWQEWYDGATARGLIRELAPV